MKGNNFFYHSACGRALAPQGLVDAGTANGDQIDYPWRIGRQITFIAIGGALVAGVTASTWTVQGLLASDGTTWEALKDASNNNLVFTAAKMKDAGELDGGAVIGTIPFTDINLDAYKAIRLTVTDAGTGTHNIGAAYVISDLLTFPNTSKTDDLWSKVRG